jgi:hypothetical protein
VGEQQVNKYPDKLIGKKPHHEAENKSHLSVHCREEYASCVDFQPELEKESAECIFCEWVPKS